MRYNNTVKQIIRIVAEALTVSDDRDGPWVISIFLQDKSQMLRKM